MTERPRESVLDQLAQGSARRHARMLPTDRPPTPEEIDAVRRDLETFRRKHKLSLAAIAKGMGQGYSATKLSYFTNKSTHLKGDLGEFARAVNRYMERVSSQHEAKRPDGFVETAVARRLLVAIKTTVDAGAIGVGIGPAGVGKTLTAQAAHAIYTGSIYHRVTQATRRGTGLLNALCKELGLPLRNNTFDRMNLVCDLLKGTGRPIFIDEAHQLAPHCQKSHASGFEVIRDIHDIAGVPVFLFGTKRVIEAVDDASVFFGQLSSRVQVRVDLTEAATRPRNPKPLYTIDEVLAVVEGFGLRFTPDGGEFLSDLANSLGLGSLRLVTQLASLCSRLPKLREKAIDAKTLRSVCKQLLGIDGATVLESRVEQRARRTA